MKFNSGPPSLRIWKDDVLSGEFAIFHMRVVRSRRKTKCIGVYAGWDIGKHRSLRYPEPDTDVTSRSILLFNRTITFE